MDTLISLAMLKVNWDQFQQDYIENFVPFVAIGLRTNAQPEVSLQQLQRNITESFGLTIPQGALKTIVKRCVKKKYAAAVHGVYRRNDDALKVIDISDTQRRLVRQQNHLTERLVVFAERRHSLKWSTEQAENALLGYVQEQAVLILDLTIEGRPIPAPITSPAHADFVVNSFIMHLHDCEPQGFEYLIDIVKGAMLANALMYPHLSDVGRHFQGVKIYFDTTLLLRLLGLEGPERAAPCRELITLLKEQHAQLRYFNHTLLELKGVMHGLESAVRGGNSSNGANSEALIYLKSQGKSASDITLEIARVEKSLALLGIHKVARPPATIALTVDEERLKVTLNDEVHYRYESTLTHDLDALTAIHRLRRGQAVTKIEECPALFVTANEKVARASLRFFTEECPDMRDSLPHCVLDHALTTIAWLKTPLSAPHLPQKQVIADCYAALAPNESLWKRYVEEIDGLNQRGDIGEDDYRLLRYSLDARAVLVNVTYNEPDAFAEGTVEQILERSRAAIRQEVEAERDTAQAALMQAQEDHLQAVETTKHVKQENDARMVALREARSKNAVHLAHTIGFAFYVIAGVGIALGSVFVALAAIPFISPHLAHIMVVGLSLLLAALSSAGLITGLTLTGMRVCFEQQLASVIERVVARISPLDA